MIVYLHVPKTGGTSVRMAAAEYFGDEAMLYDYGAAAHRTSPIVRELFYENKEPERLVEWIQENGVQFISGHFRMNRYPALFPEASLITWVRDPVARVVSQHQHRTRSLGEKRPLDEWAEKPKWQNLITRQTGTDLARFASVGVLERHAESIARLNAAFGIDLAVRHENELTATTTVPDQQRQRILELNHDDHTFVDEANHRLDETIS